MITIIAGSRDILSYSEVAQAIKKSEMNVTMVVSGTARGVDRLGEEWAKANHLQIVRVPADWDRYGIKAGVVRNKQMAHHGHALIAVWDGQSRGTANMVRVATKEGLMIYVHQVKDMRKYIDAFWAMVGTERYKANILYGQPRKGHNEGTVAAHIAQLERNLETLDRTEMLNNERYWKLKILIHVHDSFKAESQRDVAIEAEDSHASLARKFLAEYIDDADMLAIVQNHDLGYAVYRNFKTTGRINTERLKRGLEQIKDLDLFLLFCIIDSCTPSKGREMIRWFIEQVNALYPDTTVRPEHVLPGEPVEWEGVLMF